METPSRLMCMQENAEDILIYENNLPIWPWPASNYAANFNYIGSTSGLGHHFRTGRSATTDAWGFNTISFYDGHVITESMEPLFVMATGWWYEFQFVPAAWQGYVSLSSLVPDDHQPGAEWWTYPGWC